MRTAYLLWLFTGVFGGHRWYMGKRWSAFFLGIAGTYVAFWLTMILTFGMPPETLLIAGVELIEHPLSSLERLLNREDEARVIGLALITFIFTIPLTLTFDLFLIYFKLRK